MRSRGAGLRPHFGVHLVFGCTGVTRNGSRWVLSRPPTRTAQTSLRPGCSSFRTVRRPLPAPPRMRRGEISPAECMLGECVRRVARATRLSAQRQNADHIRLGGTFAAAYTRRALSPLTTSQSRIPKAWTPIPRPSVSRTRERRSATPRRALAPCSPHPALPALDNDSHVAPGRTRRSHSQKPGSPLGRCSSWRRPQGRARPGQLYRLPGPPGNCGAPPPP